METSAAPINSESSLRDSYGAICTSYHSIDDFRTKLLGFLPLASGVGIFAIINPGTNTGSLNLSYVSYVGIFGLLITIGLSMFEVYGIVKCANLIILGSHIEDRLQIVGQFNTRPNPIIGRIDEVFASGVIYSSVLSAWTFISLGAIFGLDNKLNSVIGLIGALTVLSVTLGLTYYYQSWLRKYKPRKWNETSVDIVGEPCS